MTSAVDEFKEAGDISARQLRATVYGAFTDACRELGITDTKRISEIFDIGIKSYGLSSRSYHDWAHGSMMATTPKEDMAKLARAFKPRLTHAEQKKIGSLLTFAGLYHDVAYEQVDGGLEKSLAGVIKKYVDLDDGPPYQATIRGRDELSEAGKLVRDVFGFKPGQVITELKTEDTAGGLNEFLSALAAADFLAGGRKNLDAETRKNIASVAALIEGTIPFRSNRAFEDMYERLRNLGLEEREAKTTVKAAVMLANRDVEGFCGGAVDKDISDEDRFRNFIAGTWLLMPESNSKLRGGDYPPAEFLASLKKSHFFLEKFLEKVVNPDNIFHFFREFPDKRERQARTKHAKRNLRLLDDYLTAKIASASIAEAVAKIYDPTGKLSLKDLVAGMKDRLPAADGRAFNGEDRIVFNALVDRGDDQKTAPGEKPKVKWDIPGSPIARYLMQTIGKAGIKEIAALANEYLTINDKRTAPDYNGFIEKLRSDPAKSEVIDIVLAGMQDIAEGNAPSRAAAIKAMRNAPCAPG